MEIPSKCDGWFPPEVCSWTSYHATLLGVPETYISIPFLVATAYCAQHTVVTIDFHTEPTKSASLQLVMELINNIPNVNPNAGHLFDSDSEILTRSASRSIHQDQREKRTFEKKRRTCQHARDSG